MKTGDYRVPPGVANSGGKSKMGGILGTIGGGILGSVLGPPGSALGATILGNLAGAGINFGLNRIESGIRNRYNAPKNQLRRLAQAGLPAAAYERGMGNESATSSQQYTQPDLGIAEGISKEQVNRMQKQEFEMMQYEKDKIAAEIKLKAQQEAEAKSRIYKNSIWSQYYGTGGNFARMQLAKENQIWQQGWAAKNAGDVNKIIAEVKNATKDSDIKAAARKAFNLYQTGQLLKEQTGIWNARKELIGAQKGLVGAQTDRVRQQITLSNLEEWFKTHAKSAIEAGENKLKRGVGESEKAKLLWDVLIGPINVLSDFDN